jgi:hypothetical protein
VIGIVLALAKAFPAVAAILEQSADLYRAWRTEQNHAAQADKDRRNDDAVRAAHELRNQPGALASESGGQHGPTSSAP